MRIFNRTISVIVLTCFIANTALSDLAFAQNLNFTSGNKDKLATASVFDDMLGKVEAQDMARIRMTLEEALVKAAGGDGKIDIETLKGNAIKANDSIFKGPIRFEQYLHNFINEVKPLQNGYYRVMCRVSEKNLLRNLKGRTIRTYYAVFPARVDDLKGFPVEVYTESEWNRNDGENFVAHTVKSNGDFPRRSDVRPMDAAAMRRYIEEGEKIDKFIRELIEKGDFAEIENRTAELRWDDLYPTGRIKPKSYWPNQLLDSINKDVSRILSAFGLSLEDAFKGKNLVFIKIPKGIKLPTVKFGDREIEVSCHASNNAVYMFTEEEAYDFIENCVRENKPIPVDHEKKVGYLVSKMFHEAGVAYGLYPRELSGGGFLSDLDLAGLLFTSLGVRKEELADRFPQLKNLTPVDLDILRGMNGAGEEYDRDYAASKEFNEWVKKEAARLRQRENSLSQKRDDRSSQQPKNIGSQVRGVFGRKMIEEYNIEVAGNKATVGIEDLSATTKSPSGNTIKAFAVIRIAGPEQIKGGNNSRWTANRQFRLGVNDGDIISMIFYKDHAVDVRVSVLADSNRVEFVEVYATAVPQVSPLSPRPAATYTLPENAIRRASDFVDVTGWQTDDGSYHFSITARNAAGNPYIQGVEISGKDASELSASMQQNIHVPGTFLAKRRGENLVLGRDFKMEKPRVNYYLGRTETVQREEGSCFLNRWAIDININNVTRLLIFMLRPDGSLKNPGIRDLPVQPSAQGQPSVAEAKTVVQQTAKAPVEPKSTLSAELRPEQITCRIGTDDTGEMCWNINIEGEKLPVSVSQQSTSAGAAYLLTAGLHKYGFDFEDMSPVGSTEWRNGQTKIDCSYKGGKQKSIDLTVANPADIENFLRSFLQPSQGGPGVAGSKLFPARQDKPTAAIDYSSANRQEAAEEFMTPEEATAKLNALPNMHSLESLKDYDDMARESGMLTGDFLKGLSPELEQAAQILRKTRPVDELNALLGKEGITIKQLDILRAVSEMILQLLPEKNDIRYLRGMKKIFAMARAAMSKFISFILGRKEIDNIERLKNIKSVFARYPEFSKRLITYFETRFDPDKDLETRGEEAGHMRVEIEGMLTGMHGRPDDYRIIFDALDIMVATVRTDYYMEDRTGLFLRIDPRTAILGDENSALVHTPPYALIWVHVPYGAFGAHSRYSDVARGGLRSIRPERVNLYNRVLSECVALSLTQHKKHIDIPEGGSKGAYVYYKGLNGVAAAMAYVDSLISCMVTDDNIAVSSGSMETDPLELGPDEGTADLANLITVRAWMRGLDDWRLLMTGKSEILGGVSHMENNLSSPPEKGNRVTSQGVMEHAFEMIRYLRDAGKIRSSDKEPVILSMTGGLDGDVGSGNVERAITHYGPLVKIRSIVDISGVVFDPNGLDHETLLEMYRNKRSAAEFPKHKLGKGGFVVPAKQGSGEDSYITLGEDSLVAMNNRALDPDVLKKLGVYEKYKKQAGITSGNILSMLIDWILKRDTPLIKVLKRNWADHATDVRVHSVYLRDAMFFLTRADMLVTGGGVRNSIDNNNWPLFFDWDDNPVTVAITHGANVFTEKKASVNLEKKGVVIEPDEKANSVGVEISSKMEVDFNAIFDVGELRRELMGAYFEQVLRKCLENARWKFWALRMDAEDRPDMSVVAKVSPIMSAEIIRLSDKIVNSRIVSDRMDGFNSEALNRLRNYFPDISDVDKGYEGRTTLDRIFDRMPGARIKAAASKMIAKEAVLNLGVGTIARLKKEFGIKKDADIIQAYLEEASRLDTYSSVNSIIYNAENITPREQIVKLRAVREELKNAVSERLRNLSSGAETESAASSAVSESSVDAGRSMIFVPKRLNRGPAIRHDDYIRGSSISRDGEYIFLDNAIYNTRTLEQMPILLGGVNRAQFSPVGDYLAVDYPVGAYPSSANPSELINLATREVIPITGLGKDRIIRRFGNYSRSGKYIAAYLNDGTGCLIDINKKKPVMNFIGQAEYIRTSANDRYAVVSSRTRGEFEYSLFDLSEPSEVLLPWHEANKGSYISVSHDEKYVLDHSSRIVLDMAADRKFELPGDVREARFANIPDTVFARFRDGTAQLLNFVTGERQPPVKNVFEFEMSPAGDSVLIRYDVDVIGLQKPSTALYYPADNRLVPLATTGRILNTYYSANGRYLLIRDDMQSNLNLIYDTATGEVVSPSLSWKEEPFFSSDGDTIVVLTPDSARFEETAPTAGAELKTTKVRQRNPDGTLRTVEPGSPAGMLVFFGLMPGTFIEGSGFVFQDIIRAYRSFGIGLSPTTIRRDLAALERYGYIERYLDRTGTLKLTEQGKVKADKFSERILSLTKKIAGPGRTSGLVRYAMGLIETNDEQIINAIERMNKAILKEHGAAEKIAPKNPFMENPLRAFREVERLLMEGTSHLNRTGSSDRYGVQVIIRKTPRSQDKVFLSAYWDRDRSGKQQIAFNVTHGNTVYTSGAWLESLGPAKLAEELLSECKTRSFWSKWEAAPQTADADKTKIEAVTPPAFPPQLPVGFSADIWEWWTGNEGYAMYMAADHNTRATLMAGGTWAVTGPRRSEAPKQDNVVVTEFDNAPSPTPELIHQVQQAEQVLPAGVQPEISAARPYTAPAAVGWMPEAEDAGPIIDTGTENPAEFAESAPDYDELLPDTVDCGPTWENVLKMLTGRNGTDTFTQEEYVEFSGVDSNTAHRMLSKLGTQEDLVKVVPIGNTDWRYELTPRGEDELQVAIAKALAPVVGKEVAPPVQNYTIFASYDLLNHMEYVLDTKKYSDRFGLVRVMTNKPEEMVNWIINEINKKGLRSGNAIAQLPIEFANERYKPYLNRLTSKNIKFMIIDTTRMKDETTDDRRVYRTNIYAQMLLARAINAETDVGSPLYRLLRFFIESHVDDFEGKSEMIDQYMEGLKKNEFINLVLSYKPIKRYNEIKENKAIAATLMSA